MNNLFDGVRSRAPTASFARILTVAATTALLLPAAAVAEDAAPTDRGSLAQLAFDDASRAAPHARAVWRAGQAGPTTVTGLQLRVAGTTPSERAMSFAQTHADLIGISASELVAKEVRSSRNTLSVRLEQHHDGRTVFGREVVVSMDREGRVIGFTSSALAIDQLSRAQVDEARALEIAERAVPGLWVTDKATPVVLASATGAAPAVTFLAAKPGELRAFRVVVDLERGAVAGIHELTQR
jgi:Zn-dependent metalloprotease